MVPSSQMSNPTLDDFGETLLSDTLRMAGSSLIKSFSLTTDGTSVEKAI